MLSLLLVSFLAEFVVLCCYGHCYWHCSVLPWSLLWSLFIAVVIVMIAVLVIAMVPVIVIGNSAIVSWSDLRSLLLRAD